MASGDDSVGHVDKAVAIEVVDVLNIGPTEQAPAGMASLLLIDHGNPSMHGRIARLANGVAEILDPYVTLGIKP